MQFYGKLTSNQSIGRETTQFLWEIDLTKVLEGKLCSFYGKLTSNQSIGKVNMQFLWEINF